jgi:hypothetical protein
LGIKERKIKVATEAAATFTKVFPTRMVARRLSTRASNLLTSLALLEPFFSRWSSLKGLNAMKAVSEEEKKTLSTRKKINRMRLGRSIRN